VVRRAIITGLGLAYLWSSESSAQSGWSYVFEPDSTTFLFDVRELSADKLIAVGVNWIPGQEPGPSQVYLFENGALVGGNNVVITGGRAYLNTILPKDDNSVQMFGAWRSDEPLVASLPFRAGIFQIGADLDLEGYTTMGPDAAYNATIAGCRAVDGSYSGIGVNYLSGSSTLSFHPYRFSTALDSLSSCQVYAGIGPFMAHTIHPWTHGGFLCASYSIWTNDPTAGTITILEEDLCTVRSNFSPPPSAPSDLPFSALSAIQQFPNALPLGASHIIACGEAFDVTAIGYTQRCAIQVLDTVGMIIRERRFHSDRFADSPAICNSIDTTVGHQFYYAQMEGRDPANEVLSMPCDIRIILLDSLLQPLGSYTIDGYADSALYELRRVRSAIDGSVYVLGRVKYLNTPAPRWQGWIAKVGREEFATGVQEQERTSMNIAPNPGREAFTLLLDQPLQNAQLTVADGLGRIVHTGSISGTNITIATASLAPGLYIVQVLEATGTMRRTARWVKE